MNRPRELDEGRILDEAVELFWARGYEGTSVPELVEGLGLCRQTLYRTFGDKRGLFLKAFQRYGEKHLGATLALLAGPGSPLENVRTLVRGWARYATECPGRGCLAARTAMEVEPGDDEALTLIEQHVRALEAGLIEALQRAQAAGELRPEARPERIGRSLTVAIHGISLLQRLPDSQQRIGDAVAALLEQLDHAAT